MKKEKVIATADILVKGQRVEAGSPIPDALLDPQTRRHLLGTHGRRWQ